MSLLQKQIDTATVNGYIVDRNPGNIYPHACGLFAAAVYTKSDQYGTNTSATCQCGAFYTVAWTPAHEGR